MGGSLTWVGATVGMVVVVMLLLGAGCSDGPTTVVGQIEAMDVREDRLFAITVRDENEKVRTFTVKDPGELNAYVSVEHLRDEHQAIAVPITITIEKSRVVRIDD